MGLIRQKDKGTEGEYPSIGRFLQIFQWK